MKLIAPGRKALILDELRAAGAGGAMTLGETAGYVTPKRVRLPQKVS